MKEVQIDALCDMLFGHVMVLSEETDWKLRKYRSNGNVLWKAEEGMSAGEGWSTGAWESIAGEGIENAGSGFEPGGGVQVPRIHCRVMEDRIRR